jgi:hypothetical protein
MLPPLGNACAEAPASIVVGAAGALRHRWRRLRSGASDGPFPSGGWERGSACERGSAPMNADFKGQSMACILCNRALQRQQRPIADARRTLSPRRSSSAWDAAIAHTAGSTPPLAWSKRRCRRTTCPAAHAALGTPPQAYYLTKVQFCGGLRYAMAGLGSARHAESLPAMDFRGAGGQRRLSRAILGGAWG